MKAKVDLRKKLSRKEIMIKIAKASESNNPRRVFMLDTERIIASMYREASPSFPIQSNFQYVALDDSHVLASDDMISWYTVAKLSELFSGRDISYDDIRIYAYDDIVFVVNPGAGNLAYITGDIVGNIPLLKSNIHLLGRVTSDDGDEILFVDFDGSTIINLKCNDLDEPFNIKYKHVGMMDNFDIKSTISVCIEDDFHGSIGDSYYVIIDNIFVYKSIDGNVFEKVYTSRDNTRLHIRNNKTHLEVLSVFEDYPRAILLENKVIEARGIYKPGNTELIIDDFVDISYTYYNPSDDTMVLYCIDNDTNTVVKTIDIAREIVTYNQTTIDGRDDNVDIVHKVFSGKYLIGTDREMSALYYSIDGIHFRSIPLDIPIAASAYGSVCIYANGSDACIMWVDSDSNVNSLAVNVRNESMRYLSVPVPVGYTPIETDGWVYWSSRKHNQIIYWSPDYRDVSTYTFDDDISEVYVLGDNLVVYTYSEKMYIYNDDIAEWIMSDRSDIHIVVNTSEYH